MRSEPLISVVIASYNMGKYLPVAVRSVLQQSYPKLEVLVVDDGSTDNTLEVMGAFKEDQRVHYYCQSNGGQAKAKNRGIMEAKGAFIAFLDADDMWVPDKLQMQLPLFGKSKNIGVVYTDFQCINEQGAAIRTWRPIFYSGKITGQLLIENCVTGMTSIVKRECFDAVGLFDESLPMSIDYDLWLRISVKYEFEVLDKITYLYRHWPGQMSHQHTKRYHCAVRVMQRFIQQNPNIVDRRTINEAWANTYVGRGYGLKCIERKRLEALGFYLYALRMRPSYLPAWKAILKLPFGDKNR